MCALVIARTNSHLVLEQLVFEVSSQAQDGDGPRRDDVRAVEPAADGALGSIERPA